MSRVIATSYGVVHHQLPAWKASRLLIWEEIYQRDRQASTGCRGTKGCELLTRSGLLSTDGASGPWSKGLIIWKDPLMAELAVGALELTMRPRTRPEPCRHDTVLSVTAAGVERSICETCGHVGVRFISEMSGPIFRSRYARPADEAVESPLAFPFAEEPKLGVRRRENAHPACPLLIAS